MKKIGIYPGSFDPFTNGHLYLVKQAAELFEEVVIVIAVNQLKKRRTAEEAMRAAIEKTLEAEGLSERVRVEICPGVVVRRAQELGAGFLIRGLRDGMDYRYEENLAEINYHLAKMETVYFRAGEGSYISSSMVMELFTLGEEVADLVPKAVGELLAAKGGEGDQWPL